MKKIIQIKTKSKKYDVIINDNNIIDLINKEKKFNKKIFIIIDNKISSSLKNLEKIN